jgi:hypothetical protein
MNARVIQLAEHVVCSPLSSGELNVKLPSGNRAHGAVIVPVNHVLVSPSI